MSLIQSILCDIADSIDNCINSGVSQHQAASTSAMSEVLFCYTLVSGRQKMYMAKYCRLTSGEISAAAIFSLYFRCAEMRFFCNWFSRSDCFVRWVGANG